MANKKTKATPDAGPVVNNEPFSMEHVLRMIRGRISGSLDTDAREIAKFISDLTEDPDYVLQWSQGVYFAAADQTVTRLIEGRLNAGVSLELIRDELAERMIRGYARSMSSTSPVSNYASHNEGAAAQRWVEFLDSMISALK